MFSTQIIVCPFAHIFDVISLLAVELEEPKIGISGKRLKILLVFIHRKKVMETVDSGFLQICNPCMVGGNQNEAVGYCDTCKEFLCQECFQIHLRPKPCRNHQLMRKSEMPLKRSTHVTQSLSNEDPFEDIHMCVEHSGKMVEYLCTVHNVLGCSVCMTLNHRLCNTCHVHVSNDPIPLIEMPEYKRLNTDIEQLTRKIQKSLGKIKALKNQATSTADKAVKAVTSYRNKLVKEIDKNQTELLTQIKEIKKDDVKKMESILSKFHDIENGLKEMERNLKDQENKKCAGKEAHLVVTKMVDTLKQLQRSSQQLEDRPTEVRSYHFYPSGSFLIAFQKELKTFGSIDMKLPLPSTAKTLTAQLKSLKTSSTEEKSCPTLSDKQIGGNMQPKTTAVQQNKVKTSNPAKTMPAESIKNTAKNPNQAQTKTAESVTNTATNPNPASSIQSESVTGEYITDFYIRTVTDKHASTITDMTLIENQKIAACDYQNGCIKIIDFSNNQYKLILQLQLLSQPFGVAFTGQELAVTLPYLGVIGVFNETKTFQFYRNIAVGAECRGIAYGDGKFFISFHTNPGMIRVINTTGEVLRTLTMIGGDTFHHPCHLTAHPSLPIVYISDWQVIAVGYDGSLVRKHRDAAFEDLQGISVSVDSNVYVCDGDVT